MMKRFRWKLGTLMFVVAIVALLLVIVIQQVEIRRQQAQIEQMRRSIDAAAKSQEKLTTILREQRDMIERHR
jgi:uncharacterized membrane protein